MANLVRKSTGHVSSQWYRTMLAMCYKSMDAEDVAYAETLRQATGYSLNEIYLIEAAFEGAPYQIGIKRVCNREGETLVKRLGRVFDLLLELEGMSEDEVRQLTYTLQGYA